MRLLNDDGSCCTYAITDDSACKILGAVSYVGEASKLRSKLEKDTGLPLAVHNLTHPKCPSWLVALRDADQAYCRARAADLDSKAATARFKASNLLKEARELEQRAAHWRLKMR